MTDAKLYDKILRLVTSDHSEHAADTGADVSYSLSTQDARWNAALAALILADSPIDREGALSRLDNLHTGWYEVRDTLDPHPDSPGWFQTQISM